MQGNVFKSETASSSGLNIRLFTLSMTLYAQAERGVAEGVRPAWLP